MILGHPAQANPLSRQFSEQYPGYIAERLASFPGWQEKPSIPPAQGDLVYPDWFAGEWIVSTTLLEQVAPLAPDIITPGFAGNRRYLNQPIEFRVRFDRADLIYPDAPSAFLPLPLAREGAPAIVADRTFNSLNIARAYLDAMGRGQLSNGQNALEKERSPIISVKVDPHNPNRQVTLLRGTEPGTYRQLTSTIAGRATEIGVPDHFLTTELFQQEFRGIPQPYFNTVETTTHYHYHPGHSPAITANQVTAIYLSPQDADYFRSGNTPVALYRYRLEFAKMQ